MEEVNKEKEYKIKTYKISLKITQSDKNLFNFMQNHYGFKNENEYALFCLLVFSKEQYRMLKLRKKVNEEFMEEYKKTRMVYEKTMENMKRKIREVQETNIEGYNGTVNPQPEMEEPFNMDELFN